MKQLNMMGMMTATMQGKQGNFCVRLSKAILGFFYKSKKAKQAQQMQAVFGQMFGGMAMNPHDQPGIPAISNFGKLAPELMKGHIMGWVEEPDTGKPKYLYTFLGHDRWLRYEIDPNTPKNLKTDTIQETQLPNPNLNWMIGNKRDIVQKYYNG